MIPEPSRSGTIPFGEWETWYRVTGDLGSAKTPVLVAHGGPGCSHDYVSSIAVLAESGRPVIHYDQLGGGRSTHLPERGANFWTVDLFLSEMDNLLGALDIKDKYHLLGQSWGGMLGAEHAIRRPAGLQSLVLSNSPASIPLWVAGTLRLRAELPVDVREALDRHEADGTIEDPEYVSAKQEFYDRHVCRVVPNPPEVVATDTMLNEDPTVYHTMNGPNEFYCIGTLKTWSVIDQVKDIVAPTLLVTGEFDEATPESVQGFADNVPDVLWEIIENASHMPFVEAPDRYFAVVSAFLADHDS